MGSVLLRTFCSRLIFSLFSVSFPLEARGLLLCPERQSKQNALFPKRSERSHNHRQDFHQIDFLSTFSAHLFRELQSVLIGDYSVSVLFFKGSVLPSFCLKDSSYKTSPLVSAFTKLSQSSFTLRCHYSLTTFCPTVDSRSVMFRQVIRGGFVNRAPQVHIAFARQIYRAVRYIALRSNISHCCQAIYRIRVSGY